MVPVLAKTADGSCGIGRGWSYRWFGLFLFLFFGWTDFVVVVCRNGYVSLVCNGVFNIFDYGNNDVSHSNVVQTNGHELSTLRI